MGFQGEKTNNNNKNKKHNYIYRQFIVYKYVTLHIICHIEMQILTIIMHHYEFSGMISEHVCGGGG